MSAMLAGWTSAGRTMVSWHVTVAALATMSSWVDASRVQLEQHTLAALREHVADNRGTLAPFHLPALSRQIVAELVRDLSDAPSGADAAETFGDGLAGQGLGLRAWLAVGRTLAAEFAARAGATAEREAPPDAVALQGRLQAFVTAVLEGFVRREMAALSSQRDEMQAALERLIREREDELRQVIQQLSTPVMPVHRKILVLPLIGAVDDERARRITERLLEETGRRQARIVIIDVTGLAACDEVALAAITGAVKAVRLLGARAVLAGIQPELASTLAGLDLDLKAFVTRADLQGAIEWALRELGLAILPCAPGTAPNRER
jgi:rsbT co-antagonist protein RsbR